MSGERGETSIFELVVAMSVFMVVLAATLAVFATSGQLNRSTNERLDAQDQARRTVDRIAYQLRNLASPANDQPLAIDKAQPFDFVFETVDPVGPNSGSNTSNVMRVRYCVGSTFTDRLYRQEQRWTTAATPAFDATSASACPVTGSSVWTTTQQVIAQGVTNATRPVFVYNSSTLTDISSVHVQVYFDNDPVHPPDETSLSTGVFLRNQNRRPVASFTAETSVRGKIVLNGAASADPEGEPLVYQWYDANSATPNTAVGSGVRYDYAVTPGTSHAITLKAFDQANLEGDYGPVTVVAAS